MNKEKNNGVDIEFIYSDTCPDYPPAKEIVERVVEDYEGVNVNYLQVKDNAEKIKKYDITHVPTIVINGEVEFVETLTVEKLKDRIEEIMDE